MFKEALHLNCLFCNIGIHSVCFDEELKHITAMKSLEGEVVPFKNKVLLSNNVEVSNSFQFFSNSFQKYKKLTV